MSARRPVPAHHPAAPPASRSPQSFHRDARAPDHKFTEFESEGDPTHVAVKIRLKRMGKIRAPHYRIVVADARTKRDGATIGEIGVYNPKLEPSLIRVDAERVAHWLSVGAQPTESVQALLSKTGDWQKFKGEPAPAPLLEQPVKRGRRELFDEALAASHSELRTEAVTAKKAAAKSAEAKSESGEPRTEKKAAEPRARKAVEPSAASTEIPEPSLEAAEAIEAEATADQPVDAAVADEPTVAEAKGDEA
jgi:small subunit ribosomal protein S16